VAVATASVLPVRATTPSQHRRACPVPVAALTANVPAVRVPRPAQAVPVPQPVPVVRVRALRAPVLPVRVLLVPQVVPQETVLARA
jgi:hypothetical protein